MAKLHRDNLCGRLPGATEVGGQPNEDTSPVRMLAQAQSCAKNEMEATALARASELDAIAMARQNADYQVPPPADYSERAQRGAAMARVDPPDVEHLARPACKTDTIVKRDSMTLIKTVISRLG